MKPCDCKSWSDCQNLSETGVRYNNYSIEVVPPSVFLEVGPYVRMAINQKNFKRFCEWYLTDQEEV